MTRKIFNIPRGEIEQIIHELVIVKNYKIVVERGRNFDNTYNIFILGEFDGTN